MMFPFPASQATALSQAVALKRAMSKPVKTGPSSSDASPTVPTVRKGLFRRLLDILVESRRRKARVGDRTSSALDRRRRAPMRKATG